MPLLATLVMLIFVGRLVGSGFSALKFMVTLLVLLIGYPTAFVSLTFFVIIISMLAGAVLSLLQGMLTAFGITASNTTEDVNPVPDSTVPLDGIEQYLTYLAGNAVEFLLIVVAQYLFKKGE